MDADLLRQERANARRYHRQFMAHPDPRDPDYPELPEEELTAGQVADMDETMEMPA